MQLALEKLSIDCEEISKDEHLFAHLLDETLSFEQELRQTLGYPASFPNTFRILTQAQYLQKWLAAEKNCNFNLKIFLVHFLNFVSNFPVSDAKMDAMLKTGNPWEYIDPTHMEDLKIPICADQFVRLLDAIKERYYMLPEPGHQ